MPSGDEGTRYPRKADDLEVSEVVDGYVVYQPDRDRVHYLNHTALIVLELCDGETTVDEITAAVQQEFALSEAPTAEIAGCLEMLTAEYLVR